MRSGKARLSSSWGPESPLVALRAPGTGLSRRRSGLTELKINGDASELCEEDRTQPTSRELLRSGAERCEHAIVQCGERNTSIEMSASFSGQGSCGPWVLEPTTERAVGIGRQVIGSAAPGCSSQSLGQESQRGGGWPRPGSLLSTDLSAEQDGHLNLVKGIGSSAQFR